MTEQELELLKEEIQSELEHEKESWPELDDELIYHRMGPTFYLSRWNEWQ